MWGDSIVGFGSYALQQRDGTRATWPKIGFSPRKASLTVYVMPGFDGYGELLKQLGPHTTSVSCLYLTNLEKNDMAVLESIFRESYQWMNRKYG